MPKSVISAALLAVVIFRTAFGAGFSNIRLAETKTFKPGTRDNAVRVTICPHDAAGFRIDVLRRGAKEPVTVRVERPNYGPNKGGRLVDWERDTTWREFCDLRRAKKPLPKETSYSNTLVVVSSRADWFNFDYSLLPYFTPFTGLYRHKHVVAHIDEWLRDYQSLPDRTFAFEFRHDVVTDRLEAWLDGNYCGVAPGTGALAEVSVSAGPKAEIKGEGTFRAFTTRQTLPPLVGRAHPRLREKATLTLDPEFREQVDATFDVWPIEQSVNQGQHQSTGAVRELCADPQSMRTPFKTGPEFMQWTVPNAFYRYAYVLCGDIPEKGKAPVVGMNMTRFGTANEGSFAQSFVRLDETAATNANVRKVGSFSYLQDDGQRVSSPLYLVRLKLNPYSILQYVNDLSVYGKDGKSRLGRSFGKVGDYLDFEFIGAGTGNWNPRSSVQVFGCTLERMPYASRIDESVPGNLFERPNDRPEVGVVVTAYADDTAGSVEYHIYDPLFRPVASGAVDFTLKKKGEEKRLSIDLDRPEVGWYGLDLVFRDGKGAELGCHEASYTILAPDTREAGCESPYAAWPLGGGYHNSNPNRRQQAEVMRKAGYRGSWQPPCDRENEYGFPLTCSNLGQGDLAGYCNPCGRCSAEEFEKHLDKVVAKYRASLEKFPSCRYIQLLHEQGGRDVAPCLYDPKKALVRGEYKGIDGDWDIYYCTEFAKRMRKEFPGLKIFLGNGSTSSEKVADLVRRGFDLDLVDQLGIESKGFQTMPELCCHRESPGCLWALRETGRYFGYTNLTLNACNEYVFRPEGRVNRQASKRKILMATDYSVRDYLISLAHGCGIISTGHLEDCNDAYYDTNWGKGGQCTFYPFSYPKRMYTALAVFTRVFDKATLSRCVPTGGNATYALEFRRDRKVKDYAYAFWTPQFDVRLEATFPADAEVKAVDVWGVERTAKPKSVFVAGPTPVYFISSRPVESVRILGAVSPSVDGMAFTEVVAPRMFDVREESRSVQGTLTFRGGYGLPMMPVGTWTAAGVDDPVVGKAVEMRLDRTTPAPSPLLWEAGALLFNKPVEIELGPDCPALALRVCGNGGFGRVAVGAFAGGPITLLGDTYVTFDGWRTIVIPPPNDWLSPAKKGRKAKIDRLLFGSGRQALNPVEMADVTGNLRFGGLFTCRNVTPETPLTEAERRAAAVMRNDVNDKDL